MPTRNYFKVMADALVESLLANREFWTENGVVKSHHTRWTEERVIKTFVEVLARNYANFNTSRFLDYVQSKLQG